MHHFRPKMQNRRTLQVVFISLWLVLFKVGDVIGFSHSCIRSSPAEDGHTRVTFLREETGTRSLYFTMWSRDTRLVSCNVHTNPVITESYGTLCKSSNKQVQEINQRFNISLALSPDAPCAPDASSAQKSAEREGKVRRKRSWIFPGTLWCGHGSHAGRYDQLGMFEDADRCCREHDHCAHVIPGITVNYGMLNPNFYTVSHCDCDERFKQCLLSVNDTISNMVGYSFFNIMRIPCFELKPQKQCTQMNWWGKCKVTKEAAYATFKASPPYNTIRGESKFHNKTESNNTASSMGHLVNVSVVPRPHKKLSKDGHRCVTRDPPRGDTFLNKRKKWKDCKRRRKLSTVAPSQRPPLSTMNTTTPMTPGVSNATKSSTSILNDKRMAKKSTSKGPSAYPPVKVHSEITTSSYPQATLTTQSTLLLSQKPAQRHVTAITGMSKTSKKHKKLPKQTQCCGSALSMNSQTTTATPATTANGLHLNATWTQRQTKKSKSFREKGFSKHLRTTATPGSNNTTDLKTTTSLHYNGKTQQQLDSHVLGNKTSMQLKTLKHSYASADDILLCESFKHLDKCKYKISPLETKYDLQNAEAKTAYHCNCTSRLAGHIQSFKRPTTVPSSLMESVSQYCFKLPMEKKCHRNKSCSGGFTKASDLLQALKKIEGKDTAGVRKSGKHRKRRIPVRLYKRCLRLRREAAAMAQLR